MNSVSLLYVSIGGKCRLRTRGPLDVVPTTVECFENNVSPFEKDLNPQYVLRVHPGPHDMQKRVKALLLGRLF